MARTCMFLGRSILIYLLLQLVVAATLEANESATASVQNIRYWRTSDCIRVIIDLSSEVRLESKRLTGPDRVLFDLSKAKLNYEFSNRTLAVGDELLRKIRVAQNQSDVVRVVLDLSATAGYAVSELQSPFRIVVDLQISPGSKMGRDQLPHASQPLPDEIGPAGRWRQDFAPAPEKTGNAMPACGSAVANTKPQRQPLAAIDDSQSPRPAGGTRVQSIRYLRLNERTRVFIDVDSKAHYESARLDGPDRIYFDISDAKLSSSFRNDAMGPADQFLMQVRVAQNRSDVVRVVLSIAGNAEYQVSESQNPFCIVVDLHSYAGHTPGQKTLPDGPYSHGDRTESKAVDGQTDSIIEKLPISFKTDANGASDREIDQEYPALLAEVVDSPQDGHKPFPPTPVLPAKTGLKKAETSGELEELPLAIDGTLSTGYYRSFTRGGGNGDQNIDFVPALADLNIKGYYLRPDLLDYFVKTEFNTGSQASEAGFVGGNGVNMNITALRRGAFPVTFRYSNLQLKDAYFGSLTQISSYTLKNRNKDLGVTAGFRLAGLPSATVDWGGDSVRSQSYSSALPDYLSRSNHLNLNCVDQRWGWDFQCFAGRQRQTSDLFTPQSETSASSLLRQKVTQYRGSARRGFLKDSDIYIDAGSQDTENIVLDRPIDLATRYVSANLRMFQTKRWKVSMRAGYSSNIAGLLLTQLASGLGGNGSLAPDASILQPFRRKTSYFNLNGLTSLDLSHGLSLYSSMDRTAVFTAIDSDLDSRYVTSTAGASYSRTFRWGTVSGQYGRTLGDGTITGQTGRVLGQNYVINAQPGKPDGLLFDFSIRGTSQSVRSEIPAREHSFASEGGVGIPVFGQYRARIGGGWQTGLFTNQGNEFRSKGYTARVGLDHPRFQLNGSLNSNIGNSLQSYTQALGGLGVESAFLTPLRLVPSDLRAVTITLHIIPLRKLEFSALFTRSVQHLEGIVANDFQVVDLYATYHFRKLEFVVGYFNSSQLYSSYLATYPETQRGRFYVRLARPVKFL